MESNDITDRVAKYRQRLLAANSYGKVWEIVKDSVMDILRKRRPGMMLFLDDLPFNLGAYHPVGTNNIVMNRALLKLIEAATDNPLFVKAFVYSVLLHEYLHALGYLGEGEVRPLVVAISEACFGYDHVVTRLAKEGPWALLRGIPLDGIQASKRVMEIVKDFERSSQTYIA